MIALCVSTNCFDLNLLTRIPISFYGSSKEEADDAGQNYFKLDTLEGRIAMHHAFQIIDNPESKTDIIPYDEAGRFFEEI